MNIFKNKAYQKWVNRNGREPLLSGIKYNQEQLFFISTGMSWCSLFRDEKLLSKVLEDLHSLPEFRIRGMTSNSEDFRRVFNCKTGQRNEVIKNCSIW